MTPTPDMLRFLGGPVSTHEAWWNGPWPPPTTMGLAVGKESGIVSVFDPAELAQDVRAELDACETITVAIYELRNASALPDGLQLDHVFRGAEYVPSGAAA